MRQSNVDTSRLPKFQSQAEAVAYFEKFGKMKYFGVETPGVLRDLRIHPQW